MALDPERSNAEGTISRNKDNKNHKENKRIDQRFQRLLGVIDQTINEIPKTLLDTLSKWMKNQLEYKMKTILQKISHHEIQLESLALYILFCNFENRKVLMDIYKKFEDHSLYFDNLDLLENVGVTEDTAGNMFYLAHNIISQIKG